ASPCLWLFPFCFGIWLGCRFGDRPPSPALAAASIALAAGAVTVAVLDVPPTAGPLYLDHWPYTRWSILIGVAALAGALPWAARSLRVAPLAALGRESFGIFVLNPLVLDVWTQELG